MREYIDSAPFQELAKIGKIFPDFISKNLAGAPLPSRLGDSNATRIY
jgi:hypothetical protein